MDEIFKPSLKITLRHRIKTADPQQYTSPGYSFVSWTNGYMPLPAPFEPRSFQRSDFEREALKVILGEDMDIDAKMEDTEMEESEIVDVRMAALLQAAEQLLG